MKKISYLLVMAAVMISMVMIMTGITAIGANKVKDTQPENEVTVQVDNENAAHGVVSLLDSIEEQK